MPGFSFANKQIRIIYHKMQMVSEVHDTVALLQLIRSKASQCWMGDWLVNPTDDALSSLMEESQDINVKDK